MSYGRYWSVLSDCFSLTGTRGDIDRRIEHHSLLLLLFFFPRTDWNSVFLWIIRVNRIYEQKQRNELEKKKKGGKKGKSKPNEIEQTMKQGFVKQNKIEHENDKEYEKYAHE